MFVCACMSTLSCRHVFAFAWVPVCWLVSCNVSRAPIHAFLCFHHIQSHTTTRAQSLQSTALCSRFQTLNWVCCPFVFHHEAQLVPFQRQQRREEGRLRHVTPCPLAFPGDTNIELFGRRCIRGPFRPGTLLLPIARAISSDIK